LLLTAGRTEKIIGCAGRDPEIQYQKNPPLPRDVLLEILENTKLSFYELIISNKHLLLTP
jgi:hypothetical protein